MELNEFHELYHAMNVVHARYPQVNLIQDWLNLLEQHDLTHEEYIQYARQQN